MTPMLTFVARSLAGIGGGLVVGWTALDISPGLFIERIPGSRAARPLLGRHVKAPVFALVLAMVGCRQGLLVGGDVVLARPRTTSSVVQAIFLVIVLDAMFAIFLHGAGRDERAGQGKRSPSACAGSTRASANRSCTKISTSTCGAAKSSASSARRAPASPCCCARSSACSRRSGEIEVFGERSGNLSRDERRHRARAGASCSRTARCSRT